MSTIVQSSYPQRPDEMTLGVIMDTLAPHPTDSKVARGLIKAGYGVFKVHAGGGAGSSLLDPGEVYHTPNPGAAADADAIILAITSSLSVQSFSGAALNGVVGASEMQPPRRIDLILSSHADWDATNAVLTGLGPLGQVQTENLAIPNGGAATVTSALFYLSITSLSVPAQSGTGGTATLGVAALPALVAADFRGVALRQPIKATLSSGSIYSYPGQPVTTQTADYLDSDQVPVLTGGGIVVYSEEAIADGDPVYVRVAAGAGGSVLGAFRNDADTASCVLVPNAKFKRDSAGAGPAWASF